MEAWCWDWDGKNMVKVYHDLKIKRFRGTVRISRTKLAHLCGIFDILT